MRPSVVNRNVHGASRRGPAGARRPRSGSRFRGGPAGSAQPEHRIHSGRVFGQRLRPSGQAALAILAQSVHAPLPSRTSLRRSCLDEAPPLHGTQKAVDPRMVGRTLAEDAQARHGLRQRIAVHGTAREQRKRRGVNQFRQMRAGAGAVREIRSALLRGNRSPVSRHGQPCKGSPERSQGLNHSGQSDFFG